MRVGPALARIGAVPAAILVPLAVATAAMAVATFGAERAVRSLADGALAGAARSISLAAERGLAGGRIPRQGFARLFSERVVAYALVVGRDGTVLFHTNPDLVGTSHRDVAPGGVADPFAGAGRRVTLGTGVPAWVEDRPLRLADGSPAALRVAVYTAPVDRTLSSVRLLRWGVLGAVAALWGAGGSVILLARRAHLLEQEAARREELALVGQMTATLAHEIRNAIGGVKGYAQLAAERTGGDDPRARQLAMVLRGAARIEVLAADLLAFAREETYDLRPLHPAAVVEAALASVPWGGRVEIAGLPDAPVLADAGKLERALVDGIRNAVEAMGEGGTLRIGGEVRDGRLLLRIEDEGPGLDAAAAAKVFTPFFTTKASGTGLGLATARKTLAGMGGSVGLANRAGGGGAVLTIAVPLAGGG